MGRSGLHVALVAVVLSAGSACGRLGFGLFGDDQPDASVCVTGEACVLEGLCLAGAASCDGGACVAVDPVPAGTGCVAGACDDAGVCAGARGMLHQAQTPSPSEVGFSVAIDGTRAIVGAWNPRALGSPGAAVVFEYSDGAWIEQARIVPTDSAPNDGFGSAVAIEGDRIMIGARRRLPAYQGAVYVYELVGATWELRDIITVAGVINLGTAIAMDGPRALVTAHLGMIGGGWGSGYIVERATNGTWPVVAALTSPNADSLGWSADLEGDRAVLGSLWTNDAAGKQTGAAHVFERGDTGAWTEVATLQPAPPPAPAGFWAAGSSVSLDGDRLAVGDQFHELDDRSQGGIVIWERDATGAWSEGATLREPTPLRDAQLGRSILLRGDQVLATSVDYVGCQIRINVFRRQLDGAWRQTGRIEPGLGCSDGEAVEGMVTDLDIAVSGTAALVGYPLASGVNGDGGIIALDLTGLW